MQVSVNITNSDSHLSSKYQSDQHAPFTFEHGEAPTHTAPVRFQFKADMAGHKSGFSDAARVTCVKFAFTQPTLLSNLY